MTSLSPSRRSFLGRLSAVPSALSLRAATGKTRNVLFIVADDLRTELGCYGSPNVHTPNIDRLARQGVLFERNYCQFPLCQPSRVSLLSGLRPDSTRVQTLHTPTRAHLEDSVFLPEYFRRNGYFTAHSGKVYHTGRHAEDPRSWDESSLEFGKVPPHEAIIQSGRAVGPQRHTFQWNTLKYSDAEMPDGIAVRKAISYIEKALREDRPFFVGAGLRRPHAPYAAPKEHFDRHPWQAATMPEGPAGQFSRLLPASIAYAPPPTPLTQMQIKQFRAAYFACVDFVDTQIGVLLNALDRLGLWKNTAVVLTADHGYHLGELGGLWHKLTLFENSTRVPLIVYDPDGKANGSKCNRLTESVDIYPTLVELCGLDSQTQLEGRSLVPLLRDPHRPWKRGVYSMVTRARRPEGETEEIAFLGRTLRTERWRYTEWDDGTRGVELYDHTKDPGELRNLAAVPSHSPAAKELARLLHDGWRSALPPTR
jgi:iduronate 2-sulfatase